MMHPGKLFYKIINNFDNKFHKHTISYHMYFTSIRNIHAIAVSPEDCTVYPKKYAHGFCFAVLCCGYTLTDFPYPPGLLHWHCGNLTIAPVPAKQPWWIWINISCEFIINDCITTTKQSTTKPCASFLGYTVCATVVAKRRSINHNSLIPLLRRRRQNSLLVGEGQQCKKVGYFSNTKHIT